VSVVSQNATLPVAFSANDGADYRSGVHSHRIRIPKGLQPRVSQFVRARMQAALNHNDSFKHQPRIPSALWGAVI
jgi:hypothetical protein